LSIVRLDVTLKGMMPPRYTGVSPDSFLLPLSDCIQVAPRPLPRRKSAVEKMATVHAKKLTGGPGKDGLNSGSASDVLLCLDGNDTLVSGAGSDVLSGIIGVDSISYAESNAVISISFVSNKASGGMAPKDTILGFENVLGSSYNDNIVGGRRVNFLDQDAGNDTIMGSAVFSTARDSRSVWRRDAAVQTNCPS
jgi:Ca2+-binding RTX toxin-like protein